MRFKTRRFTIPQQYEALRGSTLVQNGKGKFTRDAFNFECVVCPTAVSRVYRIRISYAKNRSPQVVVLEPDLVQLAGDRRLPHVYSQKPTRLCLYLPRAREWSDEMLISRTMLPWAILWFYYFEHWLATDQWEGGGEHPGEKTEITNKKKKR